MISDAESGRPSLAVIGVGNTLAGDDGAGNRAVEMLRERYGNRSDILFHCLRTDPLELWDILPGVSGVIFLDAVAGNPPGRLVAVGRKSARRAYAPSLHHMDLPTVVKQLCSLGGRDDLPWSIWGVTVDIPRYLGEGLSGEVRVAVDRLVGILSSRIDSGDFSVDAPIEFEIIDDTEQKGLLDG